MENILQELNQLGGVEGSFVATNDGRVSAQVLTKRIEPAQLELLARAVSRTLLAPDAAENHLTEFDLQFARGRVAARKLQNGILVVLCVPTINTTFLSLRINIAAKKLDAVAPTLAAPADARKTRLPPETLDETPAPASPRIKLFDDEPAKHKSQ